ncbi:MAG: glycoside hydrolase family 9 protein [Bacteroidia bacterium]|nr:glycoside hydrolase family 9 protein [Bacteroidia bacterium]
MGTLRNLLVTALLAASAAFSAAAGEWIRINQVGYLPNASKVAVYISNSPQPREVTSFTVIDAATGGTVYISAPGDIRNTGATGELTATFRLNFSPLTAEGTYYLVADGVRSPEIRIGTRVYDGSADFVLNYMRQQRCGWNPFMKDSCHVHDGYIRYHPEKEGQHIDVRGGWHDASDCLQYTTTSANAIYQMMFAYQQNPEAFGDEYLSDGTPGSNGIPDIVDEIYWGLDWLDRMNPEPGEFYNQIADDRDHVGMRFPARDHADYGWGPNNGRPVYFITGEPQQRYKGLNATQGAASTVGKFASDFALGAKILAPFYPEFAAKIGAKAADAYQLGIDKPGACQTASVVSPYIYEEDNWVDDMELGAVEMYHRTADERYLAQAIEYARREPVTPWMGADSARHYQWYPFMNMGHYHLAKDGNAKVSREFIRNIRSGISRTFEKADGTPFLYGIPSIWCSNNLTTAMLTQCILYRQLTGDETYKEMEGALRDWLMGCNPWGVCMIVELPGAAVYPTQPHSFIPKFALGNTTGGLVDGPVYPTIFESLKGVNMEGGINYMEVQPGVMVYHDSIHDYSTNEPTMDGTASLTFPLSAYEKEGAQLRGIVEDENGVVTRVNTGEKKVYLVFTAHFSTGDKGRFENFDGVVPVLNTLKAKGVKGSFFPTGECFRQSRYRNAIKRIIREGHYLSAHSDKHLQLCSGKRSLVTADSLIRDIRNMEAELGSFGLEKAQYSWMIPPYESCDAFSAYILKGLGYKLVNPTPGLVTSHDWMGPDSPSYLSAATMVQNIKDFDESYGLNGAVILIHAMNYPDRSADDRVYSHLDEIIDYLRGRGYDFGTFKEL